MTSPNGVHTDPGLIPGSGAPRGRRTAEGHGSVLARVLVPLYLVAIASALLIPDPHAVGTFKYNLGTPLRQLGGFFTTVSATAMGDVIGNVVGFIPLTLLLCLGWRRVPGRIWGIAATLLSIAAETAQYLLPINRRADPWNIVQNSAGAWIGVGLAVLILRWGRNRPH
ncbi:VanZ family protein [Acidipropionibacterium acidipropionici]|uniref:VanZ family protein n=1 Tax=Acidipropionibacterium acidipropionici TaxID=1748 RepID=UPI00110AB1D4|nr:VanZ family protein [Acidipropionibacterium acidipropionici]QCV95986.1 VanZ family protein [Acidipropionibacterium acidipropionici]